MSAVYTGFTGEAAVSSASRRQCGRNRWHSLFRRPMTCINNDRNAIQCELKKNPIWGFPTFSQNGSEFLVQILHAYYKFLFTLTCKFMFSYLQLSRSYAILSATIQFTQHAQNVHHRPKRTLAFSDIFPKQLRIFTPNFTRSYYTFISTLDYNFLFTYLQLWRNYVILNATTQRAFRPIWWTFWAL